MNGFRVGSLIAGLLLALATPTRAVVYEIEADGSGDHPTIRAALAEAVPGDEIVLGDGVYTGADNRVLNYLGKAISIRSASDDPTACIIDCEGVARGVVSFTATASPSLLRGVTIRDGYHPVNGGGLYVSTEVELRVENCVIEGCSSIQGGGVVLQEGARVTFVDCVIRDNEAMEGGGMFLFQGASPRIESTLIVDNRATRLGGAGIWAGAFCSPELVGSTVSGNQATGGNGAGMFVHAGGHLRIESSILWGNCTGSGGASDLHLWDLSCSATFDCSLTNLDGHSGVVDHITLGLDVLDTDPLFCGDDTGCGGTGAGPVDGYGLADNSPCGAASSPCGIQIGALGEGACGVGTPVRTGSWALLKSRFH